MKAKYVLLALGWILVWGINTAMAAPPLQTDAGGEYSLLVPRGQLMDAVNALRAEGCNAPATTQDADYVFDTLNPLYAALQAQLPD